MKNKLICIGFLGSKECYLNVTEEEARARFAKSFYGDEGADPDEFDTKVIEFDDKFCVYDIWEAE